ncbi:MAG: acylphosphatase [Candidatus Hadarchaeaceae archaeon]|nr:acylphosphatase [Hadesarchaea archaeon]MDH5685421.1 acylphosphatase [Hadesarchaea archaeon]
MKARAHMLVSGMVQGVSFRYYTQDLAQRLGVHGWVRNTRDGQVEAMFEGEKEVVERMLEFCRRGPSGASVTNFKVKWENYRGEFSDFKVRYW